jgi:peptidoglycan/xylan/chitin deacetylase (PgdA/CDA1 family)
MLLTLMQSTTSVYLTFDDGPDPEWTPRVLDALAAAQMTASFFIIGRNAQRCRELVRRAATEGHAIGNHTYSHRHPWTMSSRSARAEVIDGAKAVAEVLGAMPKFYRPPHGRVRRCMSDAAASLDEAETLWDRSIIDWGWLGTSAGISSRLSKVAPGEIVLMHDGVNRHNRPDQLLAVLPAFIADLPRRGLCAKALT